MFTILGIDVDIAQWLQDQASDLWANFQDSFLDPMSSYSFQTLMCALIIALAYLCGRRWRQGRPVRLRTLMRGLFGNWLTGASFRTDLFYLAFNTLLFFGIFGWAVCSGPAIRIYTQDMLTSIFGERSSLELSPAIVWFVFAFVMFLFFEFSYWVDHYISHNVQFFWEFHKIHHQSEALSPATNARFHPVDAVKFYNITILSMATSNGIATYLLLGSEHSSIHPSMLLAVLPFYLFQHLQHSKLWITFGNFWGHIFISPAHHQIHHSMDPADFNSNLGQILAIWDWLFGTLRMPSKQRQYLHFGVEDSIRPHSLYGASLAPFARAASLLYRGVRREARHAQSPG